MENSRTVSTVIGELITAREEDGLSVDYLSDLKIKFRGFSQKFGGRIIAGITAKEISDWVCGLKVGPVSKNTVRSRLATLFSSAKKAGYTKANPIADVERAKERETEVGILTVAEAISLLENAKVETLPFWAIGAFAGLRSAEVERLEWHDIDFDDGLIEVKASKAKPAPRRLVTMLPNLRAWLAPYRNYRGMICPIGLRKKLEADRKRAGLLKEWPSNALRHSFGSYHLSEFKTAAALALQMGVVLNLVLQTPAGIGPSQDAGSRNG